MSTQDERLYHVIVVNDKTETKVRMTAIPCTHKEACTILSKLTSYPRYKHIRNMLEDLDSPHRYRIADVAWPEER
jgi:hypothetical protein